ncbi:MULTISPECIES: hypothetical protein [Burkholderia cepacia complex]|uniref:hypothetical protein n=1 Tax=Burkholderia cepacia complex TaxID=87882 RepID=UPI0015822B79|nr:MULTISPECIES: hypothetical protein [Burkholderia cepacia complex]
MIKSTVCTAIVTLSIIWCGEFPAPGHVHHHRARQPPFTNGEHPDPIGMRLA